MFALGIIEVDWKHSRHSKQGSFISVQQKKKVTATPCKTQLNTIMFASPAMHATMNMNNMLSFN